MTKYQLPVIFFVSFCVLSTTVSLSSSCNIKYRLNFRNGTYKDENVAQGSELLQDMDLEAITLIHFPGYLESIDLSQIKALINGYLYGTNFNVISCDYTCVSQRDYVSAVVFLDDVAKVVAKSITNMVTAGMDQTKLILSGMSLGSQLCGFIGRKLPFDLPKIIAGDPAGPLFNIVSPSLSASDARCVICIHADMGFYGTSKSCNHIDFYLNGGTREQPGCSALSIKYPLGSCSHVRAEEMMTEAARHPNAFIAVNCNSWDDFKAGNCNRTDVIPVGVDTPCAAVGKFYLQTNSAFPLSKGSAGTVYQN